jgi:hypothetical protein
MPLYCLKPVPTHSALSRAAIAPERSYAIHFVTADDPAYIPHDFEVWPLYHPAITEVLSYHPEAHDAAVEAVKRLRLELRGLQNRDLPPGTRPSRLRY